MFNEENPLAKNPIRWGLIGGGRGSEIGYSHRAAAARDRLFDFVAGALDVNPDACLNFGLALGLAPERCYSDYQTLFAQEQQRPDGIQAVSIATPNATHYEIAKAALEANLHVICEKPVTFYRKQAETLKTLAQEKQRLFAVMYGYTGHVMVQQAKQMIARGDIGAVRVVQMQFAHGFHHEAIENHSPAAKWRLTPAMSGPSFILGDCGTHVFYLAEMLTGLKVTRLLCNKQAFVPSRAPLEDNAHVLMEFNNGAVGSLWASAVNAGSNHQQQIRIVGEKASLFWWDEHPNQLSFEVQGKPTQILDRGMPYLYLDDLGVNSSRIGTGHGEGFFESWANLYHRFALAIDAFERHDKAFLVDFWYPDINAGLRGVAFVEACIASVEQGSQWQTLP